MPRSFIWPIYAALTVIVLVPIWSMQVPGLGDTMNHLARMHVLTQIDTSPALQRFYEVHWTPIPYLAMDAIVPVLARAMPLYVAGKIFVMACVLMPVLGGASLHYAVQRRFSLVPAAGFLLSYNYLLATGFLNYLFSMGFAVLLFALWVASDGRPRWWRATVFAPFLLLLYFGHAFACLGYCLSVAGFEVAKATRAKCQPAGKVAADFLAAASQALPALVFASRLDVHAGYVGALQTYYGDTSAKVTALISPFLFLAEPRTGFLLLAALLLAGAFAPRLVLARQTWPSVLLVGLAALAMPTMVMSTWGLDLRFPLFTAILLIGSASFRPSPPWAQAAGIAALVALVTAKTAFAGAALGKLDSEITEMHDVVASLPHGSRLLVVDATPRHTMQDRLPANTRWHLPLMAVIERDAFVPYLFNGLTTLRMRPDYLLSSTPNGFPLTPQQFRDNVLTADHGSARVRDDEIGGSALYWRGWPQKFDYVLIMRFGQNPGKLPDDLVQVARSANLDLYRVTGSRPPT